MATEAMSRLDQLYRKLLFTKFFTKGWGSPDNLHQLLNFRKRLSDREECNAMVDPNHPIYIDKYDQDWYVGSVMEVDTDELDIKVNSLHPKGPSTYFKYPIRVDELLVSLQHIITGVTLETSNHRQYNIPQLIQDRIIQQRQDSGDCLIFDGHFTSPFTDQLPGVMPKAVQTARFQMILPKNWTHPHRPVCIHLAGTGDHGFWRRRTLMARPLIKENQIGSIILENPFYGCRKPKEQMRSSLQNVSDLFVMGGALVLESLALLNWCERLGFGPLGISGVSMGGHMASAAACSWFKHISLIPLLSWSTASQCFTQMASLAASSCLKPLSFVPCLSWSTASMVWTQGVLSGAVHWNELQSQYKKDTKLYESELSPLIKSPEQHRWQHIGRKFVENYPSSVEEMENLQKDTVSAGGEINSYSTAIPVIGPVLQAILSKLKDTQLESSIERLKSLDLHSPNLPLQPLAPEVVYFMRGVMDECTHLGHFSPPVDTSLTIAVTARHDGYIPRDRVMHLEELWPGCEIRYIDQGHVSAFLFKQHEFRAAVVDSFNRQIEKYYKHRSQSSTDPVSNILNQSEGLHENPQNSLENTS